MKIITNNPYRTLGVLAGANTREVNRQTSRLQKIIAAEQEPPTDDFSFPSLGNLTRTIESIEGATSKLNLDSDKMNAALFWFWNGNPITDEVAFDSLKEGDMEEAYQIWDKLIVETKEEGQRFWRPVTEKNASAFHNHFVLEMLRTNGNKHNAIVSNLYFLGSEFSQKFISTIADSTHKTNSKELQINFLNEVLQEVQKSTVNLSLSKLVSILNSINFIAKDDFLKSISQKFVNNISSQIEIAKKQRTTNNANAAKAGDTLCTQTKVDLEQLKSIVGVQGFAYSNIADKVANEVLQCSIDFFNHSQDIDANNDYQTTSMKLAQLAKGIAVGNLTKERIEDNINTLEEMKDREILQAIELLKSVKDAYEENRRKIKQEVKRIEETDIQIKLGYKSINWSAVEDNIKNSINWQNVNDLLLAVLSDSNLNRIKGSDKNEQKKVFLELANWLKENSLKSSTISAIIEKYKKIPPKLPFKIISSVITNTDKDSNPLPVTNPLYTKHTRYVGLKINVECYEKKSVTFYKKYIGTNGRCSSNDRTSPKGYTNSTTVNIYENTRVINLSGWGNSDKCTYEIGKHRIEVYVDEYMIHSVDFVVDLAPSEKLEIELKKAENRLIEVNNTQFFKSELEIANAEMSEIQKFQLFRSSSAKQTQISEQQKKITDIQQKAINEKKKQIEQQNKIIYKIKSDLQIAEY